MRYVVIGASGILAPLGAHLAERGHLTCGVSRGARLDAGRWDERVALDAGDLAALTTWVAAQPHDDTALVAYAPAVDPAGWPALAGLARHLVVVATSSTVEPGAPAPAWTGLPALVVQLGWTRDGPAGRAGDEPSPAPADGPATRWHTPAEVSAAVADALLDLRPRTVLVGAVRPWQERPP